MDPVEEECQARRAKEWAQQDLPNITLASVLNRGITNFIQPYIHQFFDNSHGLNSAKKPLKRPFNWY